MAIRIAFALALFAGFIGTAQAQTIGYADAISILQRSCGSDISRYCSKAHLANFEVTRCLADHQSSISSQCATDLSRVNQSLQARIAAQNSVEQICATDVRRRCPMTKPGRGHVLQCLLKAERTVSNACNTAITNAGWR